MLAILMALVLWLQFFPSEWERYDDGIANRILTEHMSIRESLRQEFHQKVSGATRSWIANAVLRYGLLSHVDQSRDTTYLRDIVNLCRSVSYDIVVPSWIGIQTQQAIEVIERNRISLLPDTLRQGLLILVDPSARSDHNSYLRDLTDHFGDMTAEIGIVRPFAIASIALPPDGDSRLLISVLSTVTGADYIVSLGSDEIVKTYSIDWARTEWLGLETPVLASLAKRPHLVEVLEFLEADFAVRKAATQLRDCDPAQTLITLNTTFNRLTEHSSIEPQGLLLRGIAHLLLNEVDSLGSLRERYRSIPHAGNDDFLACLFEIPTLLSTEVDYRGVADSLRLMLNHKRGHLTKRQFQIVNCLIDLACVYRLMGRTTRLKLRFIPDQVIQASDSVLVQLPWSFPNSGFPATALDVALRRLQSGCAALGRTDLEAFSMALHVAARPFNINSVDRLDSLLLLIQRRDVSYMRPAVYFALFPVSIRYITVSRSSEEAERILADLSRVSSSMFDQAISRGHLSVALHRLLTVLLANKELNREMSFDVREALSTIQAKNFAYRSQVIESIGSFILLYVEDPELTKTLIAVMVEWFDEFSRDPTETGASLNEAMVIQGLIGLYHATAGKYEEALRAAERATTLAGQSPPSSLNDYMPLVVTLETWALSLATKDSIPANLYWERAGEAFDKMVRGELEKDNIIESQKDQITKRAVNLWQYFESVIEGFRRSQGSRKYMRTEFGRLLQLICMAIPDTNQEVGTRIERFLTVGELAIGDIVFLTASSLGAVDTTDECFQKIRSYGAYASNMLRREIDSTGRYSLLWTLLANGHRQLHHLHKFAATFGTDTVYWKGLFKVIGASAVESLHELRMAKPIEELQKSLLPGNKEFDAVLASAMLQLDMFGHSNDSTKQLTIPSDSIVHYLIDHLDWQITTFLSRRESHEEYFAANLIRIEKSILLASEGRLEDAAEELTAIRDNNRTDAGWCHFFNLIRARCYYSAGQFERAATIWRSVYQSVTLREVGCQRMLYLAMNHLCLGYRDSCLAVLQDYFSCLEKGTDGPKEYTWNVGLKWPITDEFAAVVSLCIDGLPHENESYLQIAVNAGSNAPALVSQELLPFALMKGGTIAWDFGMLKGFCELRQHDTAAAANTISMCLSYLKPGPGETATIDREITAWLAAYAYLFGLEDEGRDLLHACLDLGEDNKRRQISSLFDPSSPRIFRNRVPELLRCVGNLSSFSKVIKDVITFEIYPETSDIRGITYIVRHIDTCLIPTLLLSDWAQRKYSDRRVPHE